MFKSTKKPLKTMHKLVINIFRQWFVADTVPQKHTLIENAVHRLNQIANAALVLRIRLQQ